MLTPAANHMRNNVKQSLSSRLAAVEEANNAFIAQNAQLRTALNNAAADAKAKGENIALFKAEILELTTANAEMRGYIARTLEDDTVREVGGAKQAEPVLDYPEREAMQKTLAADAQARRQPPRSVRTGPCPPLVIMGADYGDQHTTLYRSFGSGRGTLASVPKPWHDR